MTNDKLRLTKIHFLSAFICAGLYLICALPAATAQTVSGNVSDEQNLPVSNAEITLLDRDKITARTSSDADGNFSIDLKSTRNSLLLVKAQNFATFSIVLPPDFSGPLKIVLQPQDLREEVTVSITGIETRLSETPASVVRLGREALDATAAQTPDDALRQVAGFGLFRRSSSRTTNPTAQGANFRGLAGSGASRAVVLFDGLSLNDAFGGWTYWSRVPRAAVRQIEVLRGGASAFYGESALSGAVNFLTGEPEDEAPVLRFETSAGTLEGTFDASAFAAYRKNEWSFDLAAESFKTGGYVPVPGQLRGASDAAASSRHNNLFVTVARRFGSSARAFVRGNYFTENRDNGTDLQYNQTRFRQAAAGADFAGENIGAVRFRTFIETQVYDQTFSAVSADRNAETLSRIQRVPSQAFGGNVFWSRGFSDHAAAASFELRQTRGFSNETGFFGGRPSSLTDTGGNERAVSVFAQDMWRVTDKLSLNFGLRFDAWKNFDALTIIKSLAGNETSVENFPDRRENALSPRAAALYRISGSFSFLASYAKSFRAPTLNELYRGFRVGNVVTLANENLKAERADTIETGLNFTGFARKLGVSGNFFYTKVKNPVVSLTLETTASLITRQRQNVGRTRARGLEIDAEYAPFADLKFSASYLFTDSRFTEFPAEPELVGKLLPQVARHQFTFQTVYRPLDKFSTSFQARASGAQFEDDLNTLRLGSYFTLDALAAYRINKNASIFTAVENVFDNRYDIGRTPVLTVAAPRFIRIGLRFDLNKK